MVVPIFHMMGRTLQIVRSNYRSKLCLGNQVITAVDDSHGGAMMAGRKQPEGGYLMLSLWII